MRPLSICYNWLLRGDHFQYKAKAQGLGIRSKRYAMVVEDGVVKLLNVEDKPKVVEASSAEKLLEAL